jgi:hypothetical protein
MKKTLKTIVAAIVAGMIAGPSWMYGAASGHYTDLLPVGAAGDTTVISNGSGWSLTTLPPTYTMGDSLSRIVDTIYQLGTSTAIATTDAVSTFTALVGINKAGTAAFPASWVAVGRSIRITTKGRYSTAATAPTWTWEVAIGTNSVMTTGAVTAPGNQTDQSFSAIALLTISTTATTSTINGTYDIMIGSAASTRAMLNYSTSTASAASVDLNSQLTINPHFTWGTSSASNSLTVINCVVELLN